MAGIDLPVPAPLMSLAPDSQAEQDSTRSVVRDPVSFQASSRRTGFQATGRFLTVGTGCRGWCTLPKSTTVHPFARSMQYAPFVLNVHSIPAKVLIYTPCTANSFPSKHAFTRPLPTPGLHKFSMATFSRCRLESLGNDHQSQNASRSSSPWAVNWFLKITVTRCL